MSEIRKVGRPPSQDPKDILLRLRLDSATNARLYELIDKMQATRSAVVRQGINTLHE